MPEGPLLLRWRIILSSSLVVMGGINSGDLGSILTWDISWDILNNYGISWFDFSLIKLIISLILPTNTSV